MKRLLPALALVALFALPGSAHAAPTPIYPSFAASTSSIPAWTPIATSTAEAIFGTTIGSTDDCNIWRSRGAWPDATGYQQSITGVDCDASLLNRNYPISNYATATAESYWVMFQKDSAADTCDPTVNPQDCTSDYMYARFTIDANGVVNGSAAELEIFDITFSTSTGIAIVTGYAFNPTDDYRYEISMSQTGGPFGSLPLQYNDPSSNLTFVVATSSGPFSYAFEFFWPESSDYSAIASSSLVLGSSYTVTARIDRYDENTGTRSLEVEYGESLTYAGGIDPNDPYDLVAAPYEVCDTVLELGCHLRNFSVWALYPSPTALQNFSDLSTNLRSKAPFSYAYDVGTLREELFDSPQTASSTITVTTPIGDITFLSAAMMSAVPYAATIKVILAAILWMLFAEYVYLMVLNIYKQSHH